MQPMLHRLIERHRHVLIDVLAPPWTEKLLRLMPEVNEIIINPFPHGALNFAARRQLGKQLREGGYEQAIVLANSWKSALVPYFADIPLRTGFIGEMRYGLLNDARKLNKKRWPLMVQRFAVLAEAPDSGIAHTALTPYLQVSAEKYTQACAKFGVTTDAPVAIFCPGAEYGPAKRWPVQYFAELAQGLREQGYDIWLIGSPKDKDEAEKIVALGNPQVVNLCGTTNLEEAITLISRARLVVSNDSGLMHIAAALNRPLIALFGSSSPQFTPPISDKAQVLRLDLPCSPCLKRECPLGHFNCMMQLTPQSVAKYIPILARNAG